VAQAEDMDLEDGEGEDEFAPDKNPTQTTTNPIPRTQLRCHDHGVTLVKQTSRGLARNLVRLKPDISFRDHRLILSGPTKLSFVSGNILLWFPQ
jgi:hypothetical protein